MVCVVPYIMLKTLTTPMCLADACSYFADQDNALRFLAELRWPDGVKCPHCGADDPGFLKTRRIWKCRSCRKQFSIKIGTIFEDSPLGLDKWLPALWMLANSKNGVSSYEVARALHVTQKTAWFMLGRIRLAMRSKTFVRFEGEVEMDESYLGGLYGNMPRSKRARLGSGFRQKNKVGVLGVLERKRGGKASRIRTAVVGQDVNPRNLFAHVKRIVKEGSHLYTDEHPNYGILNSAYIRQTVRHGTDQYVQGRVHTNGIENFWSLLKRTIKGTYVSIDPFHVFRYLDEQAFRFNNRRASDGDRFVAVVDSLLGKRLTYRALIGADLATT
jgi:transposase-like protein